MNSNVESFVYSLSHDELMALDACLSIFFDEKQSKRDAYTESLINFPETKEDSINKLSRLLAFRGSDFFDNVTNFDRIRS